MRLFIIKINDLRFILLGFFFGIHKFFNNKNEICEYNQLQIHRVVDNISIMYHTLVHLATAHFVYFITNFTLKCVQVQKSIALFQKNNCTKLMHEIIIIVTIIIVTQMFTCLSCIIYATYYLGRLKIDSSTFALYVSVVSLYIIHNIFTQYNIYAYVGLLAGPCFLRFIYIIIII